MRSPIESVALERVPDIPARVDTRGMLLTGRADIRFDDGADPRVDGFTVSLASRALVSVVARPPARVIAASVEALTGDVNVLCEPGAAGHVQQALPGWRCQSAVLHALPGVMPWEASPVPGIAIVTLQDAPDLEHVPDALQHELTEALQGYPVVRFVPGALPPRTAGDAPPAPIAVAMALEEGRPVAFCYPALQTESLWDAAVDTLAEYRGRGLAARVAMAMVRHMRNAGRAPVWGALESNTASLSVARRLGFQEIGRLAVFTSR